MHIESVVDIAAPPETVWSVTVDVERWPEWAPTMQSVERIDDGDFEVGSSARIKQPGLEAVWTVTAMTPGKSFTWETRARGMRLIATHEMVSSENGTRSTLRLETKGLLAVLMSPFMRASVRISLEQENAGLKAACENNPPD